MLAQHFYPFYIDDHITPLQLLRYYFPILQIREPTSLNVCVPCPTVILLAAAGMSTRGASNGSGVHRARRYPALNSLTGLSHSYLPLYRTFPLDCEVKFGQVEAQHHTGKCRNRKCTFQ